jgi:hypothetical protein
MIRSFTLGLLAATLCIGANVSLAQSPAPVPDAPPLTEAQARDVQREIDAYRQEVQQRLAQGALTPDEAQRLIAWRQWQLAQQAAGAVAPSQIFELQARADAERAAFVPPYAYYDGYAPAYGGVWVVRPAVCAGRWGRGWAGNVCF